MNRIVQEMRDHISKALEIKDARTLEEAEQMYNAQYGDNIYCGFCAGEVRVDYMEAEDETHGDIFVPVRFVYLPEGMRNKDSPCHICLDCLRVNMGLGEDTLASLFEQVKDKVLEEGQSLEVATEDVVSWWCYTNLSIAGESPEVKQAVRRQLENYGKEEPSEEEVQITEDHTGQAADRHMDSDYVLKL